MTARFTTLFECAVQVFPLGSGTGSNSIALAALANPYGAIYCHETAHINVYECGAPEFFTGAKLVGLPGRGYKLWPDALDEALALAGRGNPTRVQPFALNLTQPTDFGTLYTPAEVAALCEVAHRHGLKVHMDGARFANAVAALGCSPADLTWRAGVDVLSLGATKNGAINAEAVVVFDPAIARAIPFLMKRGGQVLSKARFVSAQLERYVSDDRWLQRAAAANAHAARLARELTALPTRNPKASRRCSIACAAPSHIARVEWTTAREAVPCRAEEERDDGAPAAAAGLRAGRRTAADDAADRIVAAT